MNDISINSIAAPQDLASHIVCAPDVEARVAFGSDAVVVRGGREYTELRFPNCATITVVMPDIRYGGAVVPATVNWSSSSSDGDLAAASRTATVLAFAAKVAKQLNRWVDDGSVVVDAQGFHAVAS